MTEHDGVVHLVVGNAVGARFDHRNALAGGSDGGRHPGNLSLLLGGVDDILAVNHADGTTRDGSVPRNVGNGDCDGRADHRHYFGLAVRVNAHNGADDGNVVSHALVEQRTDRTVNYAAGEDRMLRGSSLSFEIGAGNSADGVELLLVVNGKREEIHTLSGLCGCGYGAVYNGVAVGDKAGAVGELRHFAGLDLEGSACKFGLKYSVLVECHK